MCVRSIVETGIQAIISDSLSNGRIYWVGFHRDPGYGTSIKNVVERLESMD